MARRYRKRSNNISLSVDTARLRTLWQLIAPETWLDILNKELSENQWTLKGKNDIWGCCINHTENTPSFHVDVDRGFGHCFACHYTVTDPIQLVATALTKPYDEAFVYLASNYGPFPTLPNNLLKEVQEYAELQSTKTIILSILNAELVDAATHYMADTIDGSEFEYAKRCLTYLVDRHIPIDMLHSIPLGIICTPAALYKRVKSYERRTGETVLNEIQNYMQGCIAKGASEYASPFEGWLMFANHTTPTSIGLFRIREPTFRARKNIVAINTDKDPSSVGFFGLGIPAFNSLLGNIKRSETSSVVVVEGEFDALSCIIPQIRTGDLKSIVISTGGNTNVSLDSLEPCGFDKIFLVPDWDKTGPEVVKEKLKNSKKIATRIFSHTKKPSMSTKDLHELYMRSEDGLDIIDLVTDESNYIYPHEWALYQASEEAAYIDIQDVRARTQLVGIYTKMLHDEAERLTFISEIAKALNVPEETLKKQSTPDTEEGFIELVCNGLEKVYTLMYQENTSSGKRVIAWNMETKSAVAFDLARSSSLLSIVKADLGAIVDWVEDSVGVPAKFQPVLAEDGTLMSPHPRETKTRFYGAMIENDVIPRLIRRKNLRMKAEMVVAGQGIHIPDDERVYIVNGNQVYKALLQDGVYIWEELPAPQDEEYIFETDASHVWSSAIENATSLTNWTPVDLKQTLEMAIAVLNTGFRFQLHDNECLYLAAYMIATQLVDMFDHVPWIFIHGPTSTGKSSLTQVISSQSIQKRRECLLEHSTSMDNFTLAGVKQLMKGSKLTLVLDEFEVGLESEHRTDPKHNHSRNILELLRGGISQGTKVTMGSTSGASVSYTLRFPFVASGIHALDRREDINRMNMIEMATRDPALGLIRATTPTQLILDKYGHETIKNLRHSITLAALQNIQNIRECYREIKKEFATGQHTAPGTQSRFREQLLPLLAVLKLAGYDYKEFAVQYTKNKSTRLSETIQVYEYNAIWEKLLHTNAVHLPGDEYRAQTYTVSQILNETTQRESLNLSDVGVYFLPQSKYVAVVWLTAMSGPLLRGSKYSSGRPEILKAHMTQDPRVLEDSTQRANIEVLKELRSYAGRITWRDVTFIPIQELTLGLEEKEDMEESFSYASQGAKEKLIKQQLLDEAALKDGSIASGEDNI